MEISVAINKAILHILDFSSNIAVFSEQELDLSSSSVADFLLKHLERAICDPGLKPGVFYENSEFFSQLTAYDNDLISFAGFSSQIAGSFYEAAAQSENPVSTDLLVCDLTVNGESVIGILKCNNRVGFTHQVVQGAAGVRNDIIQHYAILPNPSQKLDEYAFVGAGTFGVRFMDKKSTLNGQVISILPDIVLQCSSQMSPKDALGMVKTITRKVAESHGENAAIAVSRAKTLIIENTEVSEYLDPMELGREVFASSVVMQHEYEQEVARTGIGGAVKIDQDLAVRTGKNHKIKTDTGIEISIPIDYFQNKDYVEFINNPNGTLSIELKNIGKIVNK